MKAIEFSPKVYKKLQAIRRNNKRFHKKIVKQLRILQEDPSHKSLRLHKINRKKGENIWSISIDEGYRMLYQENGRIYFFDIGTHDEVYRKQ